MRFLFKGSGFLLLLAMGLAGTPACKAQQSGGEQTPAQQAEDLKKQLEELRKQYEMTTYQMGQRIAALEEQIDKQKAVKANTPQAEPAGKGQQQEVTVSVGQLEQAAQKAAQDAVEDALSGGNNQVGAKFQGQLPLQPTYDSLQEAETKIQGLERQVGAFEFHGYLRSGYGLNSAGGQQVAFEAPGAEAKYRLGNEAETYGEFIFVNNWLNPEMNSDKAWLKTEIMIQANTTNSTNYANAPTPVANGQVLGNGNDQFRLREAFVRGGHFLGDIQPDATFWVGERYYRRFHIEINDFYPLDLSGYGGGIEDLRLGPGKLSAAFLAGARPDITTQNGNYAKSNIDARYYDLKGPFSTTYGVWFDYATSKGGTVVATNNSAATPTGTKIPTSDGYAIGIRFQQLEWHGGFHVFSVAYGTGAASNFSSPGSGTVVADPNQFLTSTRQFIATEQVLFQPNDKFAIMPIFVYQRTKDGNPQHPWEQWVSFGARPEWFFTKYISLAFEAGFDRTNSFLVEPTGGLNNFNGWLRKFTIAPQIGAGRKFFSRPVLRAFFTYASWSNGYRGLVGGIPFEDRTSGATYGVQAETWW
jgi:maltoporin